MKGLPTSIISAQQLCSNSSQGWRAVTDATFSVAQGECVAVIGPNGSGKSSLLKAITGEFKTVNGRLLINGTDANQLDPNQKAKMVAVVAQHEHADPRLTVREYVWLGRVPHTFCCSHKEHERAVEQALEDVGLSMKGNRLIGSLSGGEQQRANIARAFAQEPKLLLLDEPTNHLDPLARLELLELIKLKGVASIAVLHDLPLVAPFADKVLLMSEQKMVAYASPDQVMQNEYITPVFGLRVVTLSHPQIAGAVHHFEAASSNYNIPSIGAA
ncbi:putative hemin ABC transporter ATP-binding protein [Vibrio nigripulchritudo SOn1]|uniref:Hemin ABC transporter ATP-binding protein n=1 Tax=Vibrio nigripulchritudo SOn1 TaxID=1238450 RepID=A0AAV2VM32_9VIBR|nr:ABC transporter ATP-binding protein [Vibrio nigripulchritudo]CCO45672.1 putative hemin ABC transporter ATP-binding protein [Vibrio nigripulchritudo SOn1]